MYYLLTGEKPIPATDRVAEELTSPHQLNTEISSQLSSAVMLAMELRPENRFQSVAEMREALMMLKQSQKRLDEKAKQKIEEEFSGKLKPPKTKDKGIREKIIDIVLFLLVVGVGIAALFTPLKDLIKGQNQEQEKRQVLDAEKRQKKEEPKLEEKKEEQRQELPEEQKQNGESKRQQQTSYSQIIQNLRNDMVLVQGGIFTMGCIIDQGNDCLDNEKPAHQVRLSSFYISKYEVTQALWQEVMGANPSSFKGCDRCPVEKVSWNDVQGFIRRLNQISGGNYRLPTEAEWEYAARGGTQSGGYRFSGGNDPGEVGWYNGDMSSKTNPVGQKKANELGLFDMCGNVWEWCSDWYGEYISGSFTNPKGPSVGDTRVLRGGSFRRNDVRKNNKRWADESIEVTVSIRGNFNPSVTDNRVGFRLALSQ
jgi:formylglycine-generating enzyme required for sulfatase activity